MKHFAFLAVCCAALALTAQDRLFEIDFDDYSVTPGLARGSKKSARFKDGDLQLRMFPGINKGNSLYLANSECVEFNMPGNFDPKQGTVTLLLAPGNWKIYDPSWQLFFLAKQKDFELRIGKISPGYIEAWLVNRQPGKKQFAISVAARCDAVKWATGKWHRLDVTWNAEKIALYIDGRTPEPTPTQIGSKTRVRPTAPRKNYPLRQELPEAKGKFWIGMFPPWQQRKEVNRADKTAIDLVSIWNRPLSAEEIRKSSEALFPAPQKKSGTNLLSIPCLKTPDWEKTARFPLLQTLGPAPVCPAEAFAYHDGKELHLKYVIHAPLRNKKHTAHDGPLWEDDSVEFHYTSPDGKNQYQFIVNGNGAVNDRKNLNDSWQSHAVAKAESSEKISSIFLTVPLADLGGLSALTVPGGKADFCVSLHNGMTDCYYHWGNYSAGRKFSAKDDIVFLNSAEAFRLRLDGRRLAAGELDAEGAGAAAKAEILPEGYSAIAYPGDFNGVVWKRSLPVGPQVFQVTAPGYRYQLSYTVDQPLEVRLNANPEKQLLKALYSLAGAGREALEEVKAAPVPATLKLLDASGRTLAEKSFSVSAVDGTAELPLPANLQQGTYSVTLSLSGNKVKFQRSVPFRVPDLSPYRERLGADHTVPAPWKELKQIDASTFEVLKGKIRFGSSPMPESITNNGSELFLSAPVWTVNGKTPQWSKPAVEKVHPDYALLTGKGKAGNVTIQWQGELWFDGAWILRFSLVPEKKSVPLKEFTIRYKVPQEFGKFVMDPIYVPWQNDRAEIALGGDARRKDNVLWLAGHEKGVFFWTRSNANWANAKNEKPLRAHRTPNGTEAELRVISRPVKLTRPAEYTMVLMGTPSRVPGPEFRMVNYNGYLRNSHCTHQSINWGSFHNKASNDDMTSVTSLKPANGVTLQKHIAPYLKKKIKLHIYSMPAQISNTEADYDYIGSDFWSTPRLNHSGVKLGRPWLLDYFCLNGTQKSTDLWCWNIHETMRKYPINGIYFDVAATKFCENPVHGCGGTDVFGQPYASSDALGLRQFLMRVYKVVHQAKGTIMLHSHVQFMPMSHSFIDFFAPGENTFHLMAKNLDYGYCEDISPEQYQTDFNHRKAGVDYTMIIQTGRVTRFTPAFKKYRKKVEGTPDYAMRALTPVLLHDFNAWTTFVHQKTVNKLWGLRKALHFEKIDRFYGYWEQDAVKSSTPGVRVSYWSWKTGTAPLQKLIVVGNFTRKTVPAGLVIDFAKLGLPADAPLRDVWNDRPLTHKELSALTIAPNHFLLIGAGK